MEKHSKALVYIKDIVYGATDGIITTFAIVAGSAGSGLSNKVVLVLGVANLLADGFSMAASNYLGTTSENSLFQEEQKREIEEVETVPNKEKQEVKKVLSDFGFEAEDSEKLTDLISANKKFWVDFMMRYELDLNVPVAGSAFWGAALTFLSFVFAGSLPLAPFLLFKIGPHTFAYSVIATGVSLFGVGAARYFLTKVNWFLSGLEMLLIGGVAAVVAYFVGYFISVIV